MDVMKDISEIEGYEDVVTWCRDFFSATDSIHADIGVSPLLYRSERNLLMSLVSYLFDYLPSEDLTTDALLTLWYYVKKMDKLNREFVHLVNLVP